MTSVDTPGAARLNRPRPIRSFPFAETIDVTAAFATPDEPSPCLPSATAVWYTLGPLGSGTLIVDLAGSTPYDAIVRVYRSIHTRSEKPEFIGCASPVWNGQLALEVPVRCNDALLAQIGTSESRGGTIVVRAEFHATR